MLHVDYAVFQPRFISRVSSLVYDLDAARLLYTMSFASEKVEAKHEEFRQKAIYKRRSKNLYEKMFAMTVVELHKQAGKGSDRNQTK